MKNTIKLFAIFTALLFISCEGDQGPPGLDGINLVGNVFETTVDFSPNNDYNVIVDIPNSIEVFESDVILVYLLEDVFPDGQGGTVSEWSQLPQIFFPAQGTLTYNFAHTFFDVRLFLGADFNLNSLGGEFTNDQTFRIAILPADFADATLSMEELLETIHINQTNIETLP